MYQIIQRNRIREDIQFCNANGDVVFNIPVDINVDKQAGRLDKAYERIGIAQLKIKPQDNSEADLKEYGEAILGLFIEIFGEESTKTLLQFYDDNYAEMLGDVFLFIENEIKPKVRAAQEARKTQLVETRKAANRAAKWKS